MDIMKVLVIGGSYFYGRVFVMQTAKQQEITVVNRGTYSMAELGAAQIQGDRRDPALWRGLPGEYDAVVDFCAYEPGDIRCVLDNMPVKPGQYIFISTVDVYRRGTERRTRPLRRELCLGRREPISREKWPWRENCGRYAESGKWHGRYCVRGFSMGPIITPLGNPHIYS